MKKLMIFLMNKFKKNKYFMNINVKNIKTFRNIKLQRYFYDKSCSNHRNHKFKLNGVQLTSLRRTFLFSTLLKRSLESNKTYKINFQTPYYVLF